VQFAPGATNPVSTGTPGLSVEASSAEMPTSTLFSRIPSGNFVSPLPEVPTC